MYPNSTWNSKKTVQKGNIGEVIVNQWLIKNGFIPYIPMELGAHPFDRLCATRDKKTIFVAEVKAKPARIYYPDTGIDIRHYDEYSFITEKYNLDVYIFFVDEDRKEIYGNILSTLIKPRTILHLGRKIDYPLKYKGIIYFPLEAMKKIADLTDQEANDLANLSGRNSIYEGINS